MVELNKLTDALKDRQKQLGSPEQVNRQLQQLKEMASQGPADDFAKDLAKGDFEKAAEELKKLQEKLAVGQDDRGREEGPQGAARRDGQAAREARQPRAAQEAARGGPQERRPHARSSSSSEMAKLDEQAKSLKKLQQLASKLGQAQEAMEKGDMKKAAEALGMTQQQLAGDGQAAPGDASRSTAPWPTSRTPRTA